MAVSKKTFKICESYFKENSIIAELGAQFVVGEEWGGYGPPYFKNVFKNLNITSFDYSGDNNSVKINLSEPISIDYHNQFDLVTNFGTTEHVKNQFTCWENIFNIVKEGGIVISEIPKKGSWPKHCKFYYDEETFKSMSKDFEIMDIMDIFYEGQGNLIYCVLKKTHSNGFKTDKTDFLNKIEVDENFIDGQGY